MIPAWAVAALLAATPAADGLATWTSVVRLDLAVGESAAVEAPVRWSRTDAETIAFVETGPAAPAGRPARGAVVRAVAPGTGRLRLEGETEAIEIAVVVRPAPPPPVEAAPVEPPPAPPAARTRPPAPPPPDLAAYLRPPGAPAWAAPPAGPPVPRPPPPWVEEVVPATGPRPPRAPVEGAVPPSAPADLPDALLGRLAPVLAEWETREAPGPFRADAATRAALETALDLLDRGVVEAGAEALAGAARGADDSVAEAASYKAAEAILLAALRRAADAETAARAHDGAASADARRDARAGAEEAARRLREHLERHANGAYGPAALYALGRALHLADRIAWAEGTAPAVGGEALGAYLGVPRRHPRSSHADDAALGAAVYLHDVGDALRAAGREAAALEAYRRAEAEYRSVAGRYAGRPVEDDALWGLGRLLERGIGDRVAAAEVYRALAESSSPLAAAAAERLNHLRAHYHGGRTPPPSR